MKKITLTIMTLGITLASLAQSVIDTRLTNESPTFYNQEVKYEFKKREILGVSGDGYYSGLFTLAPWKDNSGGEHHQLNFNKGGIFYRTGLPENTQWNNWTRILTTNNYNNLNLDGVISLQSNYDAVLTFNNTDNSFQYFQFKQSGIRKTWLGLNTSNDFCIYKENGGNIVFNGANVGIGTASPDSKLSVNGKIHTKEVKVDLIGWSDFVFYSNYRLPTLLEVENHIREKGHLKDIPSAKEVEQNGILLGEMDSKLLQKIEELTLYTIQQEKKLKSQDSKIKKLENKNEELILLNKKLIELQSRLEKLESKK